MGTTGLPPPGHRLATQITHFITTQWTKLFYFSTNCIAWRHCNISTVPIVTILLQGEQSHLRYKSLWSIST